MSDAIEMENVVSAGDNAPKICKMIAPYNDYTLEEIFIDLKGCIIFFYMRYKNRAPDYNLEMAMSDGYIGIINAIEFCKRTSNDAEGYAIDIETGEYCVKNIEVVKDGITVNEPHKVKKAMFSTLVFKFIRGAIQQGMKEYIKKNPSIDYGESPIRNFVCEDDKMTYSRRRKSEEISNDIKTILITAIDSTLSDKEKIVIGHVFNINGNGVEVLIEDPNDPDYMVSDKNANTQTTAANMLGISKQRVCMIVKKALAKLNEYLSKIKFDESSFKS